MHESGDLFLTSQSPDSIVFRISDKKDNVLLLRLTDDDEFTEFVMMMAVLNDEAEDQLQHDRANLLNCVDNEEASNELIGFLGTR